MGQTGSLEERIAASFDTLSSKQKQLARFILDKKYLVSFASSGRLGREVDASPATVVRFAQSLGYSGFSDLQTAVRREFPRHLTALERIQESLAAPPSPGDIPQQVFHSDIRNIESAAHALSLDRLNAALDEITCAARILVVGCGLSAAPVLFLTHSLKVIGFNVRVDVEGGLSLATEIAQLRSGTLLIAIDLWRYARSTMEAARAARDRGARIIAITDSSVSPLADVADHAFEAATDGMAHSLSLVAVMSLLNVFIAMLSYRVPEQVMEGLRQVDTMYRARNLLLVE
jgi:DNA-binding MurR/RpiR family transcriptional regulator